MKRNLIKFLAPLFAIACSGGANAMSIVNLNPGSGTTLSYLNLTSGDDLTPGGTYSGATSIFLFNEGAHLIQNSFGAQTLGLVGETLNSFLLHFDYQSDKDHPQGLGSVTGSFDLLLDSGEIFVNQQATLLSTLAGTDPLTNGVIYSTDGGHVRGLELVAHQDFLTINPISGGFRIAYDFTNTNGTIDEVRFFVKPSAAVPEASTWAMMVLSFGAIGWMERSRRRRTKAVAA